MGNSIVRSMVAGLLFAVLTVPVHAQTITTFAGGGPDNVPATAAAIGTPWGVVQDSQKNTYFSDNLSNRIFKVDSTGKITVLAGDIVPGHNDSQPATSGSMNSPAGIALDGAGNVYVADAANNVVRVIVTQDSALTLAGQPIPSGNIQVVAGNGTPGYSGDNGPATNASLNTPCGIWLDANGNIYIADTVNSVIRAVNVHTTPVTIATVTIQPGNIATIAGINQGGYSGDNGPATQAKVNQPLGLFVDSTGNIYIADTQNNVVRFVNTGGTISTIAGNASPGFMGDGGPATSAELNHPSAVFVESKTGNIFIADGDNLPVPANATSNERIREIKSGIINTVAGNGTQCTDPTACGDGGPAKSAKLWAPTGVFVDGSGNVFIADQNDDAIREFTVDGNIDTVMGQLLDTAYSGDVNPALGIVGTATEASLRRPGGVVSDNVGNVIIADTVNNAVRKVDTSGIISTVAGNGFPCPNRLCFDGSPATSTPITTPTDAVLDTGGNLYVSAGGDNLVRVVNNQSAALTFFSGLQSVVTVQPGAIQSLAGNGIVCSTPNLPCGDGGLSLAAQLDQPGSLFVDSTGNIYIADTVDNAIRVVNTQSNPITVATVQIAPGTIATVVGTLDPDKNGDCGGGTGVVCGDNGPATLATLNLPSGVIVDDAGNIYVADTGDNRVRVVNAQTGIITTFAGTGAACQNNCGDGGPATAAILDAPQGLFIDSAGNIFIADTGDFEIRVVGTDGNINAVVDASQSRGFFGDGGSATAAFLALPFGIGGDPFGNLFIADAQEWRIRKVTQTVITQPRADVSPTNVAFSGQVVLTGASQNVTVDNDGFGMTLTITGVSNPSGNNASDFALSNGCPGSLASQQTCNIKVTFTPAAKGNRGPATFTITDNAGGVGGTEQTVTLSGVGLVSTAIGLPTSSANPSNYGDSVTFTAVVTSADGTPTGGTVTFSDGSNTLGNGMVDGTGKATFTTSSLPAGNHSITATYNENLNLFFAASSPSAALNQVVNATFSLPPSGALDSPTLSAGGNTTATVTITPQGNFNNPINLTCSVSPSPSLAPTCSLNPTQVTPKGAAVMSTLTVSTTAATSGALSVPSIQHRSLPLYAIWLVLPAMLLGGAGLSARDRKKLITCMLLALAVTSIVFMVACGGGGSSGGNGGGGSAGTPAGAYTITVTATSGNTVSHQQFPLTVQ